MAHGSTAFAGSDVRLSRRPGPAFAQPRPACRHGGDDRGGTRHARHRSHRGGRVRPTWTAATLPSASLPGTPDETGAPFATFERHLERARSGRQGLPRSHRVLSRVLPVGTSYPLVDVSDHSISLTYPFTTQFGGTSTLTVTGSRARGATSQTLIQRAIGQLAPDASADYQIPGAYIGYQPGSGWVYEAHAASSDGSTQTYQLSVLASVVNGFGITVVTEGTLLKDVASKSPLWDGNPSPAAVNVDYVANDTVNSITFPGLGSP